jgi:AP-3 complex subunit beta
MSPYVRKAAALAIPKCFALSFFSPLFNRMAYLFLFFSSLDSNHLPALIQIITTLLRDRSPLSLGCVAAAFEAVCPTRLDLLHEHYRRLCRILVEVDEWGQVDLINLLLRYARTMLPRPMGTKESMEDGEEEEEIDSDVKLLLESVEGTFQNRNPAVRVFIIMLIRFVLLMKIYTGGNSRYESDILRSSSILLA